MDLNALKADLSRYYNCKIELHTHTHPASICSEVSPKELVATYKALGFSAVVLTNHFRYQDDEASKNVIDRYLHDFEEAEEYGNEIGIKAYLGAEIKFTENKNEYLLFGVDRQILEDVYDLLPYGVENFRKEHKLPNSVFIQAHPMRDGMRSIDPALLDGVEVFNMHPHHNSRIGLASLYAKESSAPIITAGSDYHHPNKHHEGLGAIRTTYLPKDSFALAKLLREGDFLIEIGSDHFVLL